MKLIRNSLDVNKNIQPPSGGCVLKLVGQYLADRFDKPAAFRRLCVETMTGRLGFHHKKPAAFRRLCVETTLPLPKYQSRTASRLQAAVC